jgi:hypothetical protein
VRSGCWQLAPDTRSVGISSRCFDGQLLHLDRGGNSQLQHIAVVEAVGRAALPPCHTDQDAVEECAIQTPDISSLEERQDTAIAGRLLCVLAMTAWQDALCEHSTVYHTMCQVYPQAHFIWGVQPIYDRHTCQQQGEPSSGGSQCRVRCVPDTSGSHRAKALVPSRPMTTCMHDSTVRTLSFDQMRCNQHSMTTIAGHIRLQWSGRFRKCHINA